MVSTRLCIELPVSVESCLRVRRRHEVVCVYGGWHVKGRFWFMVCIQFVIFGFSVLFHYKFHSLGCLYHFQLFVWGLDSLPSPLFISSTYRCSQRGEYWVLYFLFVTFYGLFMDCFGIYVCVYLPFQFDGVFNKHLWYKLPVWSFAHMEGVTVKLYA